MKKFLLVTNCLLLVSFLAGCLPKKSEPAITSLANAGILDGKKVTAFSSEASNLQARGATYTGEPVTVDGKVITASGPQAAREFGKAIVECLKG